MDIIIQVNYSDTLTGFVLKQYKRADVEYYHDCVVIILSLINYVYLYSRLYLLEKMSRKGTTPVWSVKIHACLLAAAPNSEFSSEQNWCRIGKACKGWCDGWSSKIRQRLTVMKLHCVPSVRMQSLLGSYRLSHLVLQCMTLEFKS